MIIDCCFIIRSEVKYYLNLPPFDGFNIRFRQVSGLIPLPFALCPLLFALCPLLFALYSLPLAPCPLPIAHCPLPIALYLTEDFISNSGHFHANIVKNTMINDN